MADATYDVIVIGGGPGGYVAAIRAAQLGMQVAVVERENMGGVCLNWGCIPTKALLRSAEIKHLAENADAFGLAIKDIGFDIKKVVKRSRDVAGRLSGGVGHLMKKNKITVIEGEASLGAKNNSGREVLVGKQTITAKKAVILATGARARSLKGIEADGKNILTYREAMVPDTMPKSLIIVGSGAIGIEFASFYADMGAEVTVLEAMERILPAEDEEISAMAEKMFTGRGIKIHKGVKLESAGAKSGKVVAKVNGKNMEAGRMILAVGIIANTENLGLEKTKIKLERGHVVTDGMMQTAEPGIYAIGDMTGAPWLAHKASHEGIIAAEHIAGKKPHALARDAIPGCTYCRPQIASVGLTESAAIAAGHKIKVGRFPLLANGKAIALGDDAGMIKTIFDEATGGLLGAHMIGAEVTELIQGYAIARTLETTEAELLATVFPHPTISEAMHESVLDAYGRAIHF